MLVMLKHLEPVLLQQPKGMLFQVRWVLTNAGEPEVQIVHRRAEKAGPARVRLEEGLDGVERVADERLVEPDAGGAEEVDGGLGDGHRRMERCTYATGYY